MVKLSFISKSLIPIWFHLIQISIYWTYIQCTSLWYHFNPVFYVISYWSRLFSSYWLGLFSVISFDPICSLRFDIDPICSRCDIVCITSVWYCVDVIYSMCRVIISIPCICSPSDIKFIHLICLWCRADPMFSVVSPFLRLFYWPYP